MQDCHGAHAAADPLAFLAGGGEMAGRIREIDWSRTPLGPIGGWPQSLRSALSIGPNSSFPIAIDRGGELVLLYDDTWSPIPGEEHPWVLGRPGREAWPEVWGIIDPVFRGWGQEGDRRRSREAGIDCHLVKPVDPEVLRPPLDTSAVGEAPACSRVDGG